MRPSAICKMLQISFEAFCFLKPYKCLLYKYFQEYNFSVCKYPKLTTLMLLTDVCKVEVHA